MGGNIPDVGGTTSRSGRKLTYLDFIANRAPAVAGYRRSSHPNFPIGQYLARSLFLSSIFSPTPFACLCFLPKAIGGVPIKPSNCQLQRGWSKRMPPEV